LFWWDRTQSRLIQPEQFDVLLGSQINGVVKRDDASYWLATQHGVWRWNGADPQRVALIDVPAGTQSRVLLDTSSGRLLLGSTEGLLEYAEEEQAFKIVPGAPRAQDVTALHELSDGRLLAGTLEERIWFEHADQWLELGIEDGLPANSAFAFGEHAGQLWVAGLRGIYEMPLSALGEWASSSIERIPAAMVINERGDVPGAQQGHCCNGAGNAKGVMVDGHFWLPTRSGLVNLVPERIRRHTEPPPLFVDRVRIDGVWRPLKPGDAIELGSEQRDLAFGVSVLSFQDPTSVNIAYRMVGLSDSWQLLEEPMQRQLVYTNLPSGHLELEVNASNQAGVWTTAPTTVNIHVSPFLHETAWFRAFVLLALLLLLWTAMRWRLHALHRQRKALALMVAERTEQLRQANESLRDYSRRMEEVSMTDALTGLWNRRYLLRQLPADLAHYHRERARSKDPDTIVLFALLDLDDFKQINDAYGHKAGDELLCRMASLLSALVRQDDYVVRWGGEEFLIVLRQLRSDEIAVFADRLVRAVRNLRIEPRPGQPLRVTCSVGLSHYPLFPSLASTGNWELNVMIADKALYHVKRSGKDGWCHLKPGPSMAFDEVERQLDHSLLALLESGQLVADEGGREPPADDEA
jgi:diguanylate cyclase (GGDEF)-like protein